MTPSIPRRRPAVCAVLTGSAVWLSVPLDAGAAAAAPAPSGGATSGVADRTSSAALGFDVETDPTAFVLGGYSLHAGVASSHLRFDVGAFALDIPEFVHGNDGFDASFRGFGAKVHYYFSPERNGAFVGIEGGYTRFAIEHRQSEADTSRSAVSGGVSGGYRIAIADTGLYVTPWLGVGYVFGLDDIVLAGESFTMSPVAVFPAVHVGYRFD